MAPTLERGLSAADALAWSPRTGGTERLRLIGAVKARPRRDRALRRPRPAGFSRCSRCSATTSIRPADVLHLMCSRHCALMCTRALDTTGFTLVHGDVNPGNILAPRTGNGRVYLADRQPFDWSLTTWLGVSDLRLHDGPLVGRRAAPALGAVRPASLPRRAGVAASPATGGIDCCSTTGCACSIYVAVEWPALEADRTRMRWVWDTATAAQGDDGVVRPALRGAVDGARQLGRGAHVGASRSHRAERSPTSIAMGRGGALGPAKQKWNSPRSPHGSTPGGSVASSSSSNVRPANDSGKPLLGSTHVMTARSPPAIMVRASAAVSRPASHSGRAA